MLNYIGRVESNRQTPTRKIYVSFEKMKTLNNIYHVTVGNIHVGYISEVYSTHQCLLNIYFNKEHEIGECYDTLELAKEAAIDQIKKMFENYFSIPAAADTREVEIDVMF
jgi:predicted DNA-binding protein YlxM (UPF0122 family)